MCILDYCYYFYTRRQSKQLHCAHVTIIRGRSLCQSRDVTTVNSAVPRIIALLLNQSRNNNIVGSIRSQADRYIQTAIMHTSRSSSRKSHLSQRSRAIWVNKLSRDRSAGLPTTRPGPAVANDDRLSVTAELNFIIVCRALTILCRSCFLLLSPVTVSTTAYNHYIWQRRLSFYRATLCSYRTVFAVIVCLSVRLR